MIHLIITIISSVIFYFVVLPACVIVLCAIVVAPFLRKPIASEKPTIHYNPYLDGPYYPADLDRTIDDDISPLPIATWATRAPGPCEYAVEFAAAHGYLRKHLSDYEVCLVRDHPAYKKCFPNGPSGRFVAIDQGVKPA